MKKVFSLLLSFSILFVLLTGCASGDYKKAKALYDKGDYKAAAPIFEELKDYEDSAELLKECYYNNAKALSDAGDYKGAVDLYKKIPDYKDTAVLLETAEKDAKYEEAAKLLTEENFEEAAKLFGEIPGHKDADEKHIEANSKLMLKKYGNVVKAISGKKWFFAGTEDHYVRSVHFADTNAEIKGAFFDGNGSHEVQPETVSYVLTDSQIVLPLAEGQLEIPYQIEGEGIKLGNNGFLTEEEINQQLQGYWALYDRPVVPILGELGRFEYHLRFDDGKIFYEDANEGDNLAPGEYYFTPLEEGTYTICEGFFDTSIEHGHEIFFDIEDGKATPYHYLNKFSRDEKETFPGKDGYTLDW